MGEKMGVNMFMRTQHQIHYPNTSKDMALTKYVMAACGCRHKKGNIMKKTQFIINLEDEDYYVKKGDTSWKGLQ